MVPARDLLNRIKWDKRFGTGAFTIGILDHIAGRIVQVPFGTIEIEEGNRFSFRLEDDTGEQLDVPFHRVREIYRDGLLIWRRPD